MSAAFAPGTPLAATIQNIIQQKLGEYGWTSGSEDSTLSEYIVLMITNGKNTDQIAAELSNDLLDLGPDNQDTIQFARWLFDEVRRLEQQGNGGQGAGAVDTTMNSTEHEPQVPSSNPPAAAQDAEMEEASDLASPAIPTGPKAMRNGNGATNGNGSKAPRDKRMLSNLNRHLDRADDSGLHRIRGTSGTGRINSHASRDPPRGPRQQQLGRGMAAMANGRGMGGMAIPGLGGVNPMASMGGMPGANMPPMDPSSLNPQQQMALLQMYEQQAQMMQQIFSGQAPATFVNPNFPAANRGRGKSLYDRMDKSSKPGYRQPLPQSTKFSKKENQDETMTDHTAEDGSAMEVEGGRPEPSQTMCKFNLSCGKPDCPFAHQSPAAPPGAAVDMHDVCSFGAACMNKKCAGKHPSPAQRENHKAETECAFYPNCRDMANCPYKHPSMPPCRNGADCTVPGCKFVHSKTPCRYNPCTNKFCAFKHVEGQKRTFEDKVWIAPKNGETGKEHISERKFVDEDAEEELILPGRSTAEDTEITT